MLKISIIIPIYNVEQYIEKCFESIIKQKGMFDVEIICVDDGSTDNSGIICDQYAKKDKRFKVIHKKNQGVASARNKGLDKAQGKYIAWIDPDDYIADNWYEKINTCIEKDIDFIFFDHINLTNEFTKEVRYEDKSGYIKKEKFLKELVLDKKIKSYLCTKVMKKVLFNNIRLPVKYRVLEDYAIMHRLAERAKTIYYISDCLYFYLLRNNSLSNSVISIDDYYRCYLISKDRYKYLTEKNIKISKIDYLLRASTVCFKFYQLKNFSEKNKFKFNICKNELKKNMKYILISKEANFSLRLKSIASNLNILGLLVKIYSFFFRFK